MGDQATDAYSEWYLYVRTIQTFDYVKISEGPKNSHDKAEHRVCFGDNDIRMGIERENFDESDTKVSKLFHNKNAHVTLHYRPGVTLCQTRPLPPSCVSFFMEIFMDWIYLLLSLP